jgi:hypothetical protein
MTGSRASVCPSGIASGNLVTTTASNLTCVIHGDRRMWPFVGV